ncbi:hypothetical protein [Arthrobacter sp. SW1]|uniref:glycoside hydrolase 5 family protein n=1 Tax=Arthrobacter sp. SW1 TaxID=1920889 RepID=UPI001C0CD3C4|nr:hypothetical protein [Arthrobacter sp. SW1]
MQDNDARKARPLRLGANYTPSRGWFHSWQDFDADEVRRDLESIAKLGLDHIRVFPLWPELQPSRSLIRRKTVEDVGTVVDVAAEFGLDASVDVLQGHLSSFDFLPAWLHSWHRRNMFTDPDVVAAEAELLRALAAELSGRSNALGLTIGNETNQFAAPWHPDPHRLSSEEAGSWLGTLLGAAKEAWPAGTHQHSFDDSALFKEDMPFTPRHAATLGDLSTVHSWVFGGAGAALRRTAPRAGPFRRLPGAVRHGLRRGSGPPRLGPGSRRTRPVGRRRGRRGLRHRHGAPPRRQSEPLGHHLVVLARCQPGPCRFPRA